MHAHISIHYMDTLQYKYTCTDIHTYIYIYIFIIRYTFTLYISKKLVCAYMFTFTKAYILHTKNIYACKHTLDLYITFIIYAYIHFFCIYIIIYM